ncbi:MAG: DUF2189 domain-containing protein [Burkholderiales bacterium]
MTTDAHAEALPSVNVVPVGAPFRWLAAGARDYLAHPMPSAFYGACFALMGWLIALTLQHAFQYVSALTTGFFLVGPFVAIGIYDLSRRRERDQPVTLAPTLDAWRANTGAIGVFAIVLAVILLVWARASLVVFALFYTGGMPTLATFLEQFFAVSNVEFLLAYACVGGFFALFTFAVSVVSVPMMLDRRIDGVVAVLTSLRAFGANVPAMLLWAGLIVVVIAAGFALFFAGLVVAVPLIGHATWHAYRELVR